jgi:hypothetical protein
MPSPEAKINVSVDEMQIKERSMDIAGDFVRALQAVPELASTLAWVTENPLLFARLIEDHIALMTQLCNYTDTHADFVRTAYGYMTSREMSVASTDLLDFIGFLTTKGRRDFVDAVQCAFDSRSASYHQALTRLAEMMLRGHEVAIAQQGERPQDGDPVWDQVIWGHTQLPPDARPEAFTTFFLGHFLSQYMNITLGEAMGMVQKDDFLEVLTDVIMFEETHRPGFSGELMNIWRLSRAEGGLQWIRQPRVEAFQRALQERGS